MFELLLFIWDFFCLAVTFRLNGKLIAISSICLASVNTCLSFSTSFFNIAYLILKYDIKSLQSFHAL
uniref:Bm14171 n=1 Tax=Brugia malayi TaxID=6279 RepID=A0A1I9G1D3_BRUMA|nr:Bm14171 [Brugia malayi]